jgi:hypothetical protein
LEPNKRTAIAIYDLYGPVNNDLMQANPLQGQLGKGWVMEMDTFFGPPVSLIPVDLHNTVSPRIFENFEMTLMLFSGGYLGGSWHCPFNSLKFHLS